MSAERSGPLRSADPQPPLGRTAAAAKKDNKDTEKIPSPLSAAAEAAEFPTVQWSDRLRPQKEEGKRHR